MSQMAHSGQAVTPPLQGRWGPGVAPKCLGRTRHKPPLSFLKPSLPLPFLFPFSSPGLGPAHLCSAQTYHPQGLISPVFSSSPPHPWATRLSLRNRLQIQGKGTRKKTGSPGRQQPHKCAHVRLSWEPSLRVPGEECTPGGDHIFLIVHLCSLSN